MPPEIPDIGVYKLDPEGRAAGSPYYDKEKRRIREILEILNFANMAYVKAEIGEEEIEEDDAIDMSMTSVEIAAMAGQTQDPAMAIFLASLVADDEAEAEKEKIKRAGLITQPREFDEGTVRSLIDQTTDQVISQIENSTNLNGDMLMKSGLTLREATKNDVLSNMYLGVSVDEEAGKLVFEANIFDQATDSVSKNILNRVLNAKGNQLRVDPTMPLVEHMMEPILLQGAKDGSIAESLVVKLLGVDKITNLEERLEYFSSIDITDEASLERAVVNDIMRQRGQLEQSFDAIHNHVAGELYLDFFDGTRTKKGDFAEHLQGKAESEGKTFFGVPELLFEQEPVDIERFQSDEAYFNKTVFGWIGNVGGVENPSKYVDPISKEGLSGSDKKGYGEINRDIADAVAKFRDRFVQNGVIDEGVKAEAYQMNMTPAQWLTTGGYNVVKAFFQTDADSGVTQYEDFANSYSEGSRRAGYADNNTALDKDLETALFRDRSLWIGNQPVTQGRVSDQDWQRYRDIFRETTPDAAMATIKGELDTAVSGAFFVDDKNRRQQITAMAIEKGILGPDSSAEFIEHFTDTVVPRLSTQAEFSGAEGTEAIGDLYESYFEDLPFYEKGSTAFDQHKLTVQERLDPGKPPAFPTEFEWEGKTYDIPAMPSWSGPTAPQPTDFNLTPIVPQLQELALDRPEFAKWLTDQIQLPGFEQAYRDVSVPQVDKAAISDQFDLGYEDWITEFEQKQAEVERIYQAQLAIAGSEFTETGRSGRKAAEAAYTAAQAELQRERRESEASRVVGKEFMTGGGHKQLMVQAATTPAQTSQQFFESRLPGFEKRFEQSPFFKLEQERLERGETAEAKRLAAEEKRLESERRRRLTRGVGSRGRTIVTRGRA